MASPVVSNVSPPDLSTIASGDAITFDVTDADNDLLFVLIYALEQGLPRGTFTELIYDGGFHEPYDTSTATPIANGYTFIVNPFPNGWPAPFLTLRITAIDSTGNQTDTDLNFDVSDPDITAPTFGNFSPPKGAGLASNGAASFSVDDIFSNTINEELVTATFEDGTVEQVWSAGGFQGPYVGGSTRVNHLTTGHTFSIVRAGGWPAGQVTLGLYARDDSGNFATDLYSMPVINPIPVIDGFTPPNASSILKTDQVFFDVTDTTGFGRIAVYALFDDGRAELVHDGSGFASFYSSSSRTPIANGFTYGVRRVGYWPTAGLTLAIYAIDFRGAESQANYALTVTDPEPADTNAPVVGNFSPTVGTPIQRTDPLFFDVTDDSGEFRRVLVTVGYPDGTIELAHTGDVFTTPYIASSERDPIEDGWHFRLRRTGGWPDQPTITAYAFDKSGHENT